MAAACICASSAIAQERWELRRHPLYGDAPPAGNGVASVDAWTSDALLPRGLGEGVEQVQIHFRAKGDARRKLSVVFSGGSQGPDQFEVKLDGKAVAQSSLIDAARKPYMWYCEEFELTLPPGNDHVLELTRMAGVPTTIELSAIRMDEPGAVCYQPLCYQSIGSLAAYEQVLRGRGCLVERPHVSVFAPASRVASATKLADFLEAAYGVMRDLYAGEPVFKFSLEIYPRGHSRAVGGFRGEATIAYDTEALDRFSQVGLSKVEGIAGFTEEMSHGFKALYNVRGTYEAFGVAVQEDAVRRLVPRAVADAFWLPEHAQWRESYEAYRRAGFRNPDPQKYPEGVMYTRVLNCLLLNLREGYGPRLWPDFFKLVRSKDYPLHRASKTERMGLYADLFGELFHRDMRQIFAGTYGITLDTDPPWGWQTYR